MTRLILALGALALAQPALAHGGDGSHHGVHLRVLRDYTLPPGATANEPVVVIGGSARIDGNAEAEVIVIGGRLRVGPAATIRGDVVSVGGGADIDPAARITGNVQETIVSLPDINLGFGRIDADWWVVLAAALLALRLGVTFIVALLLTWLTPGWVGRMGREAGTAAGTSALLGVAGEVLFVPAIAVVAVALAVTIIGIPLLAGLPFLVGAALLAWAGGFAAVANRVGSRLRGAGGEPRVSTFDLLLGFTALSLVSLTAHVMAFGPEWMRPMALMVGGVGLAVEWVAWTVGLGAATIAIAGGRGPQDRRTVGVPAPALS